MKKSISAYFASRMVFGTVNTRYLSDTLKEMKQTQREFSKAFLRAIFLNKSQASTQELSCTRLKHQEKLKSVSTFLM